MRLQIARPRPVPPYRRVVEASAWLKAWNRRPCASVGDADAGVADLEAQLVLGCGFADAGAR